MPPLSLIFGIGFGFVDSVDGRWEELADLADCGRPPSGAVGVWDVVSRSKELPWPGTGDDGVEGGRRRCSRDNMFGAIYLDCNYSRVSSRCIYMRYELVGRDYEIGENLARIDVVRGNVVEHP